MTFMPCEGCGSKGLRSMLGGGEEVGLWLCTLPAFTLVSLYQLDNALMKHDRTSFHSHAGANALKCQQLHCFVALAGKENFKWPHTNVLFAGGAAGITITRRVPSRDGASASPRVSGKKTNALFEGKIPRKYKSSMLRQ